MSTKLNNWQNSVTKTRQQALAEAQELLLTRSTSAQLDAEYLLTACLHISRTQLYTWPEKRLSEAQYQQYLSWVQARLQGKPVAYIIGKKAFWTIELWVNEHVLIPRPETECLVEQALAMTPADQPLCVADLGTGSGAIALALAHERPNWQLYATDSCVDALAVAKKNAAQLNIDKICWCHGDWLKALPHKTFDMIVSNPPYIAQDDPALEDEVRQYEPEGALLAKEQGLADIKVIADEARLYLASRGALLLEHGYQQGQAVRQILQQFGYTAIRTVEDYNHHPRITMGIIN